MGLVKNAITTVAVTAILIGSLVLLFPTASASTPTITGSPGGVSAIDANGFVTLDFDMVLPTTTGFDSSKLTVTIPASTNPVASGGTCDSNTPISVGTSGLHFTVKDGSTTATGTVLEKDESQYSYAYGYNYGYVTGLSSYHIEITIKGCNFYAGADATFRENIFTFQLAYDPSGENLSDSVAARLFNPNYVAPGSDSTESGGTATSSDSGSRRTIAKVLKGAANQNLQATGQTVPLIGAGGAVGLKATSAVAKLKTGGPDIPAGTQITVEEDDGGDIQAPKFGIQSSAATKLGKGNPVATFSVKAQAPGVTSTNPGTYLQELSIQVCLTGTQVKAQAISEVGQLILAAFDGETGNAKTTQPATPTVTRNGNALASNVSPAALADGDNVCFNYVIKAFSAFMVVATAAGPGGPGTGGGGGGGGVVNPPPAPSNDADSDGLPNAWEQLYFGSETSAQPGDDPDGDGMTNLQEYQAGTNPTKADTDGDGIDDATEIAQGTDPRNANDNISTPAQPGTPPPAPAPTPEDPAAPERPVDTPGFGMLAMIAALGAALWVARRK